MVQHSWSCTPHSNVAGAVWAAVFVWVSELQCPSCTAMCWCQSLPAVVADNMWWLPSTMQHRNLHINHGPHKQSNTSHLIHKTGLPTLDYISTANLHQCQLFNHKAIKNKRYFSNYTLIRGSPACFDHFKWSLDHYYPKRKWKSLSLEMAIHPHQK